MWFCLGLVTFLQGPLFKVVVNSIRYVTSPNASVFGA